jgi:hypothetical protein
MMQTIAGRTTGGGDTRRRRDRRPRWKGLPGACLLICSVWWLQCRPAQAQVADANGLGPLYINEILAINAKGATDPQGHYEDWIEIYNASSKAIDLAGMYLTDDLSNPTKWQFPMASSALTTVLPNKYLLVWADRDTAASGLHAGFSLSGGGEQVGLFDVDGTLLDAITFGPQAADVSYGRSPDGGPDLRYFGYPTPGAKNNTAYLGEVLDPLFSQPRGFYTGTFNLTIVCPTAGAKILYTTDGTDPEHPMIGASTAKVYTSPLSIAALTTGAVRTTCVRAVAVKDGWKSSRIVTNTYVQNPTAALKSLPLISLVADRGQTFYDPNGVGAHPTNENLERPVSFEWILPADSSGIQADCGLQVHAGPWIRPQLTVNSKISWRLCFRSDYGLAELDYPLFPYEVHRFKSLVLRAGMNDPANPFVRDELTRRLFRDMGHVSCCGTIANLFINGQYTTNDVSRGYFNPTEHVDEPFCQKWFDSNQPWDVMTMNGPRDGDTIRWNTLIAYVQQHNLADNAAYNQVISQIDMEDFVDYLVLRLWSGDWDWPQNNWAAASERSSQSKWRFFVWDAEGAMDNTQSLVQAVRFNELNSQSNEHGFLYRGLKANPRFKILFGDRVYRAMYNGGALTSQNVTKRFGELRSQMATVLPSMITYVTTTWVPQRPTVFLNACIAEGVYTFAGPTLLVNGKSQYGGYAQVGDMLTMTTAQSGAAIYYTLDGIDPADRLAAGNYGQVKLVMKEGTKRILVPTGPVDVAWRGARPFTDSTWLMGTGGVGFGRTGSFPTQISTNVAAAMDGHNATCLVRIPFDFSGAPQDVNSLVLRIQYDDGFVAYLNGVEIARRAFDGEPTWNSQANTAQTNDTTAVAFRPIDVTDFSGSLRKGQNILAIHAMNVSSTDKDFLINAELLANIKPPVVTPEGLTQYTGPIRLNRTATVRARAWVSSTLALGALSEATFAVGPVVKGLRISEVMYHGREGGDPADPNSEYIELVNVGTQSINLNQVRLAGAVEFVFPAVDLAPGQYVLVVADPAVFAAQYGNSALVAGQYSGRLSHKGAQIRLLDAAGGLIEQFQYADAWHPITDGRGFSLTAVDPAADPNILSTRAGWRPSAAIGGSPGWDDAGQAAAIGSVVVSEIMANPAAGRPDWIELHNTTSQPMDIGGWFLSDSKADLTRYRISQGTTISPGGYVVFYEDRHFGNRSDPGCANPFGLSAAGETVVLTSGKAGVPTGCSDEIAFGPSDSGVSLGRWLDPDGSARGVALTSATPGQANAPAAVGPVVISEVFARPDAIPEAEYIELFNSGSQTVTLYDSQSGKPWRLVVEEGDSQPVVLDLPASPGLGLGPGGCALLAKSGPLFELRFPGMGSRLSVVQWGQGNLPDTSATVRLLRPAQMADGKIEWIEADVMSYSTTTAGKSWQRSAASAFGLDPLSWRLVSPPNPGTYAP